MLCALACTRWSVPPPDSRCHGATSVPPGRKLPDDKRFVKVLHLYVLQQRTVLSTHHCRYLRSSVVVDAGQHERRQEEEEGAGGRVDQVLQGDTDRSKFVVLQKKPGSELSPELTWGTLVCRLRLKMRRSTPVTTIALQLTNSKKYTPPQGEHIMIVSMQMNPMTREEAFRQPTSINKPQYGKNSAIEVFLLPSSLRQNHTQITDWRGDITEPGERRCNILLTRSSQIQTGSNQICLVYQRGAATSAWHLFIPWRHPVYGARLTTTGDVAQSKPGPVEPHPSE
ncbi:hypothetical protein EYF80_009230 [Liparis tanakae]|uniref:Uncharacterized protein n=1 Tax=Liparis tanakae TaxID=230148 RepID=A0A4Z2IRL6_9TELE|nr:hypothetical protein EYF80_009230 [Liparis tanakae]